MESTNTMPADVIDWTEAMQQTGDDEEFLRELLADLRQETDTQVANIEQIIQVGEEASNCVAVIRRFSFFSPLLLYSILISIVYLPKQWSS